jgi:hypothetical protein
MRCSFTSFVRLSAAALFVLSAPASLFAGGPLALCKPGRPYAWPNGGMNIPFNPDQGDLGPLTHAQGVEVVAEAFKQWGDVTTASTTYVNAGPLPVDVNFTNFMNYLAAPAPDGLSAIVFDHTGAIFNFLFGPDSGVLGFAGPEWGDPESCEITEGLAFLNGPTFTNRTIALDILVHEFGHYQNLAHTVVNGQVFGFDDHSGASPNDTFPIPLFFSRVETMYPFYFGSLAGTSSPHKDDIAALSTLYPEPSFAASTGSISGVILGSNRRTRLTGVNVIARNLANPFDDAVSAISSDFALTYEQSSRLTGAYTLRGLTPGAQYAVYVDQILAGGFSTPPRTLPGPEEFYNGANESDDSNVDNRSEFTPITAIAGAPARGINIIFNGFRPGDNLPVGDDGAVELFLPFRFDLCGQAFETVWVKGNGSVTFGAPSGDFSESKQEFLEGPARAAGIWDDLNPAGGGAVTFEETAHTFTVSWTNVPEYPMTGSNTFSVKLHRLFDRVDLIYGATDVVDGLAGVSCGGKVTSGFENQQDLSQAKWIVELLSDPAGFEQFLPDRPFDLANRTLRFTGTINYSDKWAGSNDTPAKAKRISLPFNSASVLRFTELEKAGDVDFFKFHAKAGQFLAVEILTGQLDTLLGIFDTAGNLLAIDDEGGAASLSRLIVEVKVDIELVVGITTFPDFEFAGATDTGRYVLSVQAVNGQVIPLVDDDHLEVPLGFSFPFQGTDWTSVFVNGNGNLTFGAPSGDFSESVGEFLAGPPRIAPLWDDLFPLAGLVVATHEPGAMTIHYLSVPEFFSDRANNFSVRLDAGGGISVSYSGILAPDSLVGITQGAGAADPGATDLSRTIVVPKAGTTYELFPAIGPPFDMPFRKLFFR